MPAESAPMMTRSAKAPSTRNISRRKRLSKKSVEGRMANMNYASVSLNILLSEIHQIGEPDPSLLARILEAVWLVVDTSPSTKANHYLYYALALYSWMYSHQIAGSLKQWPEKHLYLAKAHLEIWRSSGPAYAESIHLDQAAYHFGKHFTAHPASPAADYVEYFRLLLLRGDTAGALVVSAQLLSCEGDPRYPDYLFYTGVAYNAQGDFDRANGYFFEAMQYGPPALLTNYDCMMIISRNLERLHGSEEEDEEGYAMVHGHLLTEGLALDYEDWLCSSRTWLALADKCAYHAMHPLATDFYSLAILRDHEAYSRPALWFRFAKSCFRCNRMEDAMLAIQVSLHHILHCSWPCSDPFFQQALSRTSASAHVPHNPQHPHHPPQQPSSPSSTASLRFTASPAGPAPTPAAAVAAAPSNTLHNQLIRTQALWASPSTRFQQLVAGSVWPILQALGVGNEIDGIAALQAVFRGYRIRTARFSPMHHTASLGILIRTPEEAYPLLLRVRANKYGLIKELVLFDSRNDHSHLVPLSSPLGVYGNLSEYSLSLCPAGDGDGSNGTVLIKYTHLPTGGYVYKMLHLLGGDSGVEVDDTSVASMPFMPITDPLPSAAEAAAAGTEGGAADEEAMPQAPGSPTASMASLAQSLSSVYTNIPHLPILRMGLFHQQHYLLTIASDQHITQLVFLQVRTNKLFIFLILREHVTAMPTHEKLVIFLDLIAAHPSLHGILLPPQLAGSDESVASFDSVLDGPDLSTEDMEDSVLRSSMGGTHAGTGSGFGSGLGSGLGIVGLKDIKGLNDAHSNSNASNLYDDMSSVSGMPPSGAPVRAPSRVTVLPAPPPTVPSSPIPGARETPTGIAMTSQSSSPRQPPSINSASSFMQYAEASAEHVYTYHVSEDCELSCSARELPNSSGLTVIVIDPMSRPFLGNGYEILEGDGVDPDAQVPKFPDIQIPRYPDPEETYTAYGASPRFIESQVLSDLQSDIVPTLLPSEPSDDFYPDRVLDSQRARSPDSQLPDGQILDDEGELGIWDTDDLGLGQGPDQESQNARSPSPDPDMVCLRAGGDLENDSHTAATPVGVAGEKAFDSLGYTTCTTSVAEATTEAALLVDEEVLEQLVAHCLNSALEQLLDEQTVREVLEELVDQVITNAASSNTPSIASAPALPLPAEEEALSSDEETPAYVVRPLTSQINVFSRALHHRKDPTVPPYTTIHKKQPFCTTLADDTRNDNIFSCKLPSRSRPGTATGAGTARSGTGTAGSRTGTPSRYLTAGNRYSPSNLLSRPQSSSMDTLMRSFSTAEALKQALQVQEDDWMTSTAAPAATSSSISASETWQTPLLAVDPMLLPELSIVCDNDLYLAPQIPRKIATAPLPSSQEAAIKDELYAKTLTQVRQLGYTPNLLDITQQEEETSYYALTEKLTASVSTGGAPAATAAAVTIETRKRRLWAYASHWQEKLTVFLRYHSRLNSSVYKNVPSIAQLTAYNIDESETTDIHSIDSVTAEVAQYVEQHPPTGGTRPGFWLLKKQLRILKRALTTMTSHIYSVCAATSNNDMEKYNNKLFINKPPPPHRKDFVKENIALFPPPLRVAQAMAKAKKASMATAPVEEVQEEEDKLPVKVKGVLSIEEMICALAETKGSVGEVILRLQDRSLEFLSEIQLVVASLDIREMILSFRGGAYIYEHDHQPLLRPTFMSSSRPSSPSTGTVRLADKVFEDDSRWVDSKKLLRYEKRLHEKRMMDGLQTLPSRSTSITLTDMLRQNDSSLEDLFDEMPAKPLTPSAVRVSRASGLMILPKIQTSSEKAGYSKLLHSRASYIALGQTKTQSSSAMPLDTSTPTCASRRTSCVGTGERRISAAMGRSGSMIGRSGSVLGGQSSPSSAVPFTTPTGAALLDISAIRDDFLKTFESMGENGSVESFKRSRSVSFADSIERHVAPSLFQPSLEEEVDEQPEGTMTLRVGFQERTEEADEPTVTRRGSVLPKLTRKPTCRITDRVLTELFNDYSNQPTAVLNRRDERKVQVEETLLRSNKVYIRSPIEKKIAKLSTRLSVSQGGMMI